MDSGSHPAIGRRVRVWALAGIVTVLAGCGVDLSPDDRSAPKKEPAPELQLSDEQLEWIGRQVYRNECASRRACLVHWNPGEAFPSLGIGHFIWYPAGTEGRFVESFPDMVRFLDSRGAEVPDWLMDEIRVGAPWPTREAFLQAEARDDRVEQLRQLLEQEQAGQSAFMLKRARQALDRVASASDNPDLTRHKIQQLADTPGGAYALIDYVNFKGEGLAESERYDGIGWGLLQVLEGMGPQLPPDALSAFRDSAARVLTTRAQGAANPIEREQWLPGWLKRVETYREP